MHGGQRSDGGSAVVDFALVAGLLTVVFAGVMQLALALHVRTTLIDCAAAGARYAAFADRTPADGVERSRELVSQALSPGYADRVSGGYEVVDGVETVRIDIDAPLPLAGLLGPSGRLEVSGHALREPPL